MSVDTAVLDAPKHAKIYCQVGADGIMNYSKSKDPSEVLSFVRGFRHHDKGTRLAVVFTSYSEQNTSLTNNRSTRSFPFLT